MWSNVLLGKDWARTLPGRFDLRETPAKHVRERVTQSLDPRPRV